jgi:hypothetical protein
MEENLGKPRKGYFLLETIETNVNHMYSFLSVGSRADLVGDSKKWFEEKQIQECKVNMGLLSWL